MLVSSSKLFILFDGPLPLFHHGPSTLLRFPHRHPLTSPLSAVPHNLLPPSRAISPFLIKPSQRFHSQSTNYTLQENNHVPDDAYLVLQSHPWPELSELLKLISVSDVHRNIKDEFVPNESLSMEFLDAACSCLHFALDRPDIIGWLPKDDIQVLIDDGAPFLFKNAIETERRMRSFLQGEESNEATAVDLMKYILSYASNPIIYPERKIKEATELSARNLLKEMANFNNRDATLSMPAVENHNGAGEDEQTPRNLESNITPKRGDWTCPKCCLLNIAKNSKCVECEELRPPRQLTGSEWDCPQCNFFNYGKNMVCLRCECRRPGEVVGQMKNPPEKHLIHFQSNNLTNKRTTNGSSSGYAPFVPLPADMFAKKSEDATINNNKKPTNNSEKPTTNIENQVKDTFEEEKSKKWFSKMADSTSDISDEDFPEIMPMRKGENRFVVSKKKDRSLTSPIYKRQQALEQESNTNFVPFVPFPPDYFAKKDEKPSSQISLDNSSKDTNDTTLVKKTENQETRINRSSGRQEIENVRKGSLEGSEVKENDPLDMSEEAKAERWFRRVAQIKDISELSEIPDEDFPSIMPMRKGVNRFVVSKRKTPLERRLASPEYRKDIRTVNLDQTKKEGDDDR